MRVCVFTTDLGTVAARQHALLPQIAALAGGRKVEVSFVGCRQSRPVEAGIDAHEMYLDAGGYAKVKLANALLRLVDAKLAPAAAAHTALWLCAPRLVEAILACDPDVVLLDVSWGQHLKPLLDAELPGRVFVSNQTADMAHQPAAQMNPSTRVSIVLPTHNGSKYLKQSVESCLSQSHSNLELIVVDDGSTEDLRPVVSAFTDPRLRYVRHEKNAGIAAALNTGFALATGDYLTWTSDDNFYDRHAIERLGRYLQNHPGTDFVYASCFIINELKAGDTLRIRWVRPPEDLPRQNGVHACFLYTRRVYRDIGNYDSTAFLVEDYDYWVRVSKRFRMQRLFSPLYGYRYHKGSLTVKHGVDEVAYRFNVVKHQNGIA
jgi:Glycosyl transferase family 2